MQQLSKQPAFALGQIVATPGALAGLRKAGQQPGEFLQNRHQRHQTKTPRGRRIPHFTKRDLRLGITSGLPVIRAQSRKWYRHLTSLPREETEDKLPVHDPVQTAFAFRGVTSEDA
jgi:hypothetical protein